MDYSKLADAILKMSTQMEGMGLAIDEIKETLLKQRDSEINKRLERLEVSMKDQHMKLDAINGIDINPTLVVPNAPLTVKVAAVKVVKKADDTEEIDDKPNVKDTNESKEDEPKQFGNITEYFKYLWTVKREELYEKNVLTKEEYNKIYELNKNKFDKKKNNEIMLQKSIAFQIWKVLPQASKDIVYAMKNQNSNDVQKKNSTEVTEEDSEA